MSYLHCDHEEKHLTLHDCRATRVSLEDGELIFHFPNGFCIGCLHPENPYHRECELFLHADRVAYLWNGLRRESLSEI